MPPYTLVYYLVPTHHTRNNMGHKINPTAFRLGINHPWHSSFILANNSNNSNSASIPALLVSMVHSLYLSFGILSSLPLISLRHNCINLTVKVFCSNKLNKNTSSSLVYATELLKHILQNKFNIRVQIKVLQIPSLSASDAKILGDYIAMHLPNKPLRSILKTLSYKY